MRLPRPLLVLVGTLGCLSAPVPTGSAAAAAGGWRWPLDGSVAVVRDFDPPAGPYGPGHRGVDLATSEGATVRSAGAGTVVVAGEVAGRAVVVVAHGAVRTDDELRTTYQPVEATVAVGERVAAGEQLGSVGTWLEHCSKGPCLHWGLRRGPAYLDPLALVRGPVRLLPVGPPVAVVGEAGRMSRGPVAGLSSPGVSPEQSSRAAAGPTPSSAPAGAARSGVDPGPSGLLAGATLALAAATGHRLRTRRGARPSTPRGSSP